MNDAFMVVGVAVLGAVLAKLAEISLEAYKKKKADVWTLKTFGIDEVTRWGWDGRRLLKKLIDIDRSLMGDMLNEDREGTIDQWTPVFMTHPETWIILTSEPKKIVGYWSFSALRDVDFQRAKAGELMDSEVTLDTSVSIDFPGVYNLYLVLLGVLPRISGGGAKLVESFFARLESLANRGVFFKEVCAVAYTKDGERMCQGFGMTELCKHKDFGTVYGLSLLPWPKRLRHKRWQELETLYIAALENDALDAAA